MDSRNNPDNAGVIIPAISTASSTAAIRSLGKRNVRTVVISNEQSPPGFSSKYCEECLPVPDPYTDLAAYEAELLTLSRREDVQIILPFREPDIYVLSRNKEAFAENVAAEWPDLETLRRVQDRVKLFDIAREADVPIPRTERLDSWTDWDRHCIVKPRYTVHGAEYAGEFAESKANDKSTRYVDADAEPDRDELVAYMGHEPIVQEFVPTTDEYGFFALYDHGTPVATFQHRQRRGWKYSGGPSAFRESIDDPELEATGRRLLDALDWHGVAMVEFLRNPETGKFELMEVNPRYWSSLPFTIQAGVDFPHLHWQLATNGGIEGEPTYREGNAGHYLWGEFLHAYSVVAEENPLVERPSLTGTLRDIGGSLVRHPQFDYLEPDDPRPFVRDIANRLTSIAKRS